MGNRPKIDIINVLSYVLSVLIGISAILTAAWVIAEGKYVLLNLLILTMLTIASVALYLFMTYRLGSKDKLTGAMNIYTLQRYAMTLAVTRRISQFTGIFLNIKNFKYINRTIGYNNGDLVIKEYVKSIKSVLGKGEKIARLGGDNFLILCKQSHDTKTALASAISNLVSNAVEANAKKLILDVQRQNTNVVIKVADNGKGMSQEVVQKIFEPFYTTKSNGTGLGLAVVNSVIKAHQGNIGLVSEVGKGTCFTITIPLCKERVSQAIEKPSVEKQKAA